MERAKKELLLLGVSVGSRDRGRSRGSGRAPGGDGGCGEGREFVVANVEAGPVDRGRGGGEGGVGVPEEGGDVCEVADCVACIIRVSGSEGEIGGFSPNLLESY